MYIFSNFELIDVCGFKKFAEVFNNTFALSQFRRINDVTISWNTSTYGSNAFNVTSPNVFITLDFDGNNKKYFAMEVKFGNNKQYCGKFNSPIAALNYLNVCVNIIKARKKRIDDIWYEYGF